QLGARIRVIPSEVGNRTVCYVCGRILPKPFDELLDAVGKIARAQLLSEAPRSDARGPQRLLKRKICPCLWHLAQDHRGNGDRPDVRSHQPAPARSSGDSLRE